MKHFNDEELEALKDIVEEWLNGGFISVSDLTNIHYSIIEKLKITR